MPDEPIWVNEEVLADMEALRLAGRRVCEHPSCYVEFVPRSALHRYCCARHCRQHDYLRWRAAHPRQRPDPELAQARREAGWAKSSETQRAHYAARR